MGKSRLPTRAERLSAFLPSARVIAREQARRRFDRYIGYVDPMYEWNWHHRVVAAEFDAWAGGKTKFLIVNMPPRRGKSELVSRKGPGFLFGLNPDGEVIASSYADALAASFNRDVQRLMDTREHADVFPHARLDAGRGTNREYPTWVRPVRNSAMFEISGARGFYRSGGVGTGITGFGAWRAVVDDPHKDWAEASSATMRDSTWDWLRSTLLTRRMPGFGLCLTMTRWHEDDMTGRLIVMLRGAGVPYRHIRITEVREEDRPDYPSCPGDPRAVGEVLWPARYSAEEAEQTRQMIGSYLWAGMYQQRPAPEEGGVFQRGWWRYYREPPVVLDEVWCSWDMTFKSTGTSYVVGQAWGRRAADHYLLAQTRAKMGFAESCRAVVSLRSAHPRSVAVLVEDAANGQAVVDALKSTVPGILSQPTGGGKEARAAASSPMVEAGQVHLPDPAYVGGGDDRRWVYGFVEEAASFPNAAYADQVDAMTLSLVWSRARMGRVVVVRPGSLTKVSLFRGSMDGVSGSGAEESVVNG